MLRSADDWKPNSLLPRWWLARTSPWCSPSGIPICTSWPSLSLPLASTSSAIDFWEGGMKELVRKHPYVQGKWVADLRRSVLVDHRVDCDFCSDSGDCSQDRCGVRVYGFHE